MSRRTEYDESKHGINGVKTLTNDIEKGRGMSCRLSYGVFFFEKCTILKRILQFQVIIFVNARAALLTLFRVSLKNSELLLPTRFSLDS